jgi:hypothetical protein
VPRRQSACGDNRRAATILLDALRRLFVQFASLPPERGGDDRPAATIGLRRRSACGDDRPAATIGLRRLTGQKHGPVGDCSPRPAEVTLR